jgi:hypothetical protein
MSVCPKVLKRAYIKFLSFLSHFNGTVLLNNNTNFCAKMNGLYWHEYATAERTVVVLVGVIGREGKDRTKIELRQGQWFLLHTHSVSLHQIAHSYLHCLITFILKGCKNRNSFKRITRFYLIKNSIVLWDHILHYNSLSVPLKIVPRATLGTRAVGCRRLL